MAVFSRIDLSALSEAAFRGALETACASLQASLELTRGPLFRAVLFEPGAGRPGRLSRAVHHLVVDGVSWRILLEDLQAACEQAAAGHPIRLPAKTTSYRLWAERLAAHARSAAVQEEIETWIASLPGLAPRLPLDDPGAPDLQAQAVRIPAALTEEETESLLRGALTALRSGIQEVLLTCVALAVAAWTGSRRVLVDLEGHGREEIAADVDLSRTVGWFTAIHPVELDLGDAVDVIAAIKRVKEQLRAVPEGGLGYGLLRFLSGDGARRLPQPGPQVSFNYFGQLDSSLGEDAFFRPAPEGNGPDRSPRQRRLHRLEIDAGVVGGRLHLAWTHGAGHRGATIDRVAAESLRSLRTLIDLTRSTEATAFSPSDFPLARLDQRALDRIAGDRWIEDVYPLSPAQRGLLYHAISAPASGAYVYQMACRLEGRLDESLVERAWQEVLARHAALRTAFSWEASDEPLQVVRRGVTAPFDRLVWSGLTAAESSARLERLLDEDRRRGFDPARPPLARLAFVRTGPESCWLVWSCHHLVVDGWSVPLLVREVLILVEALSTGRADALERPRPYRDFIAWLADRDASAAEAYWRRTLAGFRQPVPIGSPSGAKAAGTAVHLGAVPAGPARALEACGRRRRLTLATLVQGAWALLLGHRGRSSDVVFGRIVAGRPPDLPGSEDMVGMFVNTLPVRVRIEPRAVLLDWLAELQEMQLEAQAYDYVPLADVRRWCEVPAGLPLFESTFAFNNYPVERRLATQGLVVRELREQEATTYALDLTAAMREELSLRIMYDRGRFDAMGIGGLCDELVRLLGAIAESPEHRVSDYLAALARPERELRPKDRGGRQMSASNRFRDRKPKAINLSSLEAVTRGELQAGLALPRAILPAMEEVDPVEWVAANRQLVEEELVQHGAMLFRGFRIDTTERFERLAAAIALDLFRDNGEHVRDSVSGSVYTPVFYAPDRKLLWHNENSFNHEFPSKIFFCCVKPAATGGETPIVDSRKVYEALAPRIRERFEEKGILYVRNYGTGVGLDWRAVFRTDSKAEVEERCRASLVDFEWKPGDLLKTMARRPAVARHPRTGEMSWINQAQHWHISCLDRATRESAETLFAEEDLPRNCYYGDGSRIDDRDMKEILEVYAGLEVVFPWQEGDVLAVDNMLTAHARNPFSGERKLLVAMGEMTSYTDLRANGG